MSGEDLWSRAGSLGSADGLEETFESSGKTGEQDSAFIAEQDLRNSRISDYLYHEDPYLPVPRDSEATAEAASRSSMAETAQNLGFVSNRDSRNQNPPEVESSSRRGDTVEATNAAVENIQTTTQSSPGTLLDVDNRLLKPKEYFESLEKLESEVTSRSLLDMLNVSFPVKIHM